MEEDGDIRSPQKDVVELSSGGNDCRRENYSADGK